MLLGLMGCWIGVNVLVGAWLVAQRRSEAHRRERRHPPLRRRLPTAPGPDLRPERLRPDAGAR